jgi:elongation factor Ts
MANITAADVKALRERTGLPMMDCKQALTEAEGNADKAVEILRKRGAAAAEKKAGRETAEGRIGLFVSPDRKAGALVELRCETAQVANNNVFRDAADLLAKQLAMAPSPAASVEDLLAQPCVDNAQHTVRDLITDAVNKTRENIQVARFARLTGEAIGSYQHFNGQVAVLVAAEPAGADGGVLADVCMQIAAMRPMSVTRDEVPADVVAKEREIAMAQLAEQKKPPQILEKIVDGKINKWLGERVLIEQAFVKDQSGKTVVRDVLKKAGITVRKFLRLEVGEAE